MYYHLMTLPLKEFDCIVIRLLCTEAMCFRPDDSACVNDTALAISDCSVLIHATPCHAMPCIEATYSVVPS